MHYHSAPTCIADAEAYENLGKFDGDVKDTIIDAFETHLAYRSVFGLAKDGRPIYTPMYDGGKSVDDCDVDVCNGFDLDGHYSYVSTLFHPYIVGCYGPGSDPKIAQGCSANPRMCGVEVSDGSVKLAASFVLLLANLLY